MKIREMDFVVSDEVNEETEVSKQDIVASVQDASGPIGRNE